MNIDKFIEFLKIQSISSDKSLKYDVKKCANWIIDYLKDNNIDSAQLLNTKGMPLVFAQISANLGLGDKQFDPKKPCILIYGHYDVQPVNKEKWSIKNPFVPVIKNDIIYARGAADDKGQIMAVLQGIFLALKKQKSLNYNIKLLFEGEEEIGSPNISDALKKYKSLLKSDYILVTDTEMKKDIPEITLGLRGLLLFSLKVSNAKSNLHSGIYGGGVAEAPIEISRLISKIIDNNGKILIPDFYNNVQKYPEKILNEIDKINISAEKLKKQTGAKSLISDSEFSLQQNMTIRPSFSVHSIHSGVDKNQIATVLVNKAEMIGSFRLVANQDPLKIFQKLQEFIKLNISKGFQYQLEIKGKYNPILFERNDSEIASFLKHIKITAKSVWGNDLVFNYGGGSIGIVSDFLSILGIKSILLGLAVSPCNAHGPDEYLPIDQFKKAIKFFDKLLISSK